MLPRTNCSFVRRCHATGVRSCWFCRVLRLLLFFLLSGAWLARRARTHKHCPVRSAKPPLAIHAAHRISKSDNCTRNRPCNAIGSRPCTSECWVFVSESTFLELLPVYSVALAGGAARFGWLRGLCAIGRNPNGGNAVYGSAVAWQNYNNHPFMAGVRNLRNPAGRVQRFVSLSFSSSYL